MVLERSALLWLHVPRALTSVPCITHCMCVAGASLYSYSAPGLRWFLASIRETRVAGCAGCVGLETSPPLTLNPKGVRRAVLCGSETQDPEWCGCASS